MLLLAVVATGCSRSESLSGKASREDTLRQIAIDYAASGDLAAAQASLNKLKVANPAQLLVTMAEADLAAGKSADEIKPVADLAAALGTQSPKLVAFFAPTAEPTEPPTPTLTPAPPTATVAATDTSVPPTATTQAATTTAEPVATTEPQATPQAIANTAANVRGGPGRNYPIIGKMSTGQQVDVIGRNASGDWWRVAWPGKSQAWVAGTTVRLQGPIDTVAVAKDIPTPPPTVTRAPQPTAAPATAAPADAPVPTVQPVAQPKPGVQYVVQSVRLRAIGEGAQRCDGGDHNIFVTVIDPAGNPVDGVRVREVFSGQINVTGAQGKGSGRVEYDIYRGGGGQLEIVDENNNRIGELTRGMSDDWPDFDLMKAAGYCNCKPHLDDASCESDLINKQYLFAVGHYVYEVVYRRTW